MEHVVCIENTAIRLSDVVCLKYMQHDNTLKIWFRNGAEPVVAWGCSREIYASLVETWKEHISNTLNVKQAKV